MNFWLKNYEVKGTQHLLWPVISPYSVRHFAALGDKISGWQKAAHATVALLEAVPILGQLASGCEWLAHYFFDRKVSIDQSSDSKNKTALALDKLRAKTHEKVGYHTRLQVGLGSAGLVGDAEKCRAHLLPFTDEYGREIPLNPADLLIPLRITDTNIPEELILACHQNEFYLPLQFIQGKDNIKLIYNDVLLSLDLTSTPEYGTTDEACKNIQGYFYGNDCRTLYPDCGDLRGIAAHEILIKQGMEIPKKEKDQYCFNHKFEEIPYQPNFFEGPFDRLFSHAQLTGTHYNLFYSIPGYDPKGFNFVLGPEYFEIRYYWDYLQELGLNSVSGEDLFKVQSPYKPPQFAHGINWQKQIFGEIRIDEAYERIKGMTIELIGIGRVKICIPLQS